MAVTPLLSTSSSSSYSSLALLGQLKQPTTKRPLFRLIREGEGERLNELNVIRKEEAKENFSFENRRRNRLREIATEAAEPELCRDSRHQRAREAEGKKEGSEGGASLTHSLTSAAAAAAKKKKTGSSDFLFVWSSEHWGENPAKAAKTGRAQPSSDPIGQLTSIYLFCLFLSLSLRSTDSLLLFASSSSSSSVLPPGLTSSPPPPFFSFSSWSRRCRCHCRTQTVLLSVLLYCLLSTLHSLTLSQASTRII